jgi:cell surface protein SprA
MGNTIENSNTLNLNGSARLTTLYNKVGFLRKLNQNQANQNRQNLGTSRRAPANQPPAQAENDTTRDENKVNVAKVITTGFLKILTGLKDVQFTYTESNGTLLPGFTPKPELIGNRMSDMAPGLGFVFGSQEDIRYRAARNGWLTTDTLLNNAYITRLTKNLTARATYEPFQEFRIEFTADRTESFGHQEYFKANRNGVFTPSGAQDRGSFSISFLTIKTAFQKDSDDNTSPTFEQFKDNRRIVAARLGALNPSSEGINDTTNYPVGYGPGSQDVLIPAFIAAYTGQSATSVGLSAFPSIPIPNWRFTYTGLSKIEFLKKYFKQVNIGHAYRSTYAVGLPETSSRKTGLTL